MRKIITYLVLFVTGGSIYYLLECLWKKDHTSHWSMFVLAGIVFILTGLINEVYTFHMSAFKQGIIAGCFIAAPLEYMFGLIFNADYSIWDYRGMWGTIHFLDDQVNIFFVGLWIILCTFCVWLDDYIRGWFNERDSKKGMG